MSPKWRLPPAKSLSSRPTGAAGKCSTPLSQPLKCRFGGWTQYPKGGLPWSLPSQGNKTDVGGPKNSKLGKQMALSSRAPPLAGQSKRGNLLSRTFPQRYRLTSFASGVRHFFSEVWVCVAFKKPLATCVSLEFVVRSRSGVLGGSIFFCMEGTVHTNAAQGRADPKFLSSCSTTRLSLFIHFTSLSVVLSGGEVTSWLLGNN